MNYLITKKQPDTRFTISNIVIPDGFFVVMGLTFENQKQLEGLAKRYNVTRTELPEGNYTPDGYRVSASSILDWAYSAGQLVYIDKEPVEGAAVAPVREVRPPNIDNRPEHMGLGDVASDVVIVDPPGVAAAKRILAEQAQAGITTPAAPERTEQRVSPLDQVNQESDAETLGQAKDADDEVAMLRAALDVRGVEYSPLAKAANLRKKLETATA